MGPSKTATFVFVKLNPSRPIGNQDIDLVQLAPFWRDTPDKEKRALLDQFRTSIAKEWGESDADNQQAGSVKSRVV